MAPFLATTVFLLPEAISSSLHQMRTRTNLSGVLSSNGRKGRRRRQKRDGKKNTEFDGSSVNNADFGCADWPLNKTLI